MRTTTLFVALSALVASSCGTEPELVDHVFVANLSGNNVTYYNGETGAVLGEFVEAGAGGLVAPTGLAFGPDGDLYVSSSGDHRILRFDGETGAFKDVFAEDSLLRQPFSLIFESGGDLLVSSDNRVLRFEAESGKLAGVAVDSGLTTPIGLRVGPDGLLYVANAGGNAVERFDTDAGERRESFVSSELSFPSDIDFGPDSVLYVSSGFNSRVLAFDLGTRYMIDGAVMRFPDGGVPVGLAFGNDGQLYVSDFRLNRLYRVDAPWGTPLLLADSLMADPENIVVQARVP